MTDEPDNDQPYVINEAWFATWFGFGMDKLNDYMRKQAKFDQYLKDKEHDEDQP